MAEHRCDDDSAGGEKAHSFDAVLADQSPVFAQGNDNPFHSRRSQQPGQSLRRVQRIDLRLTEIGDQQSRRIGADIDGSDQGHTIGKL